MRDVSGLSSIEKAQLAEYIKRDNLDYVNKRVQVVSVRDSFYTRYGKRFLDIILSVIALIITFPINILLAIATYIDVGCPILFKQKRTGMNKEEFYIYKFRNMTNETDAGGNLLPPSERVTKWGKFVRKTSLDELLNFVSVLCGDMSFVGPRPLLNEYADRFNIRDRQRYFVRPGLECPSIKKLDHPMNWQERLDNDIWYVQNCSLWVDIKLVFRIIQIAFDSKATSIRSTASAGGFLGYNKDGSIITTKTLPDKYYEELFEKDEAI